MNHKELKKGLLLILLTLLGLNNAYAYTISPLETVTNNIAKFFNFQVFTSQTMQIGFLRFLLWIMLFAVLFWSGSQFVFKGDEGRKTAGIVAAIMALIGVVFMPENAITGIGTAYAGLFFTLLTVGIAFAAVYIAFGKLKAEDKSEWWKHLIGFMVLLFAILILNVVQVIMSGGVL
jgi:hypothetical protein